MDIQQIQSVRVVVLVAVCVALRVSVYVAVYVAVWVAVCVAVCVALRVAACVAVRVAVRVAVWIESVGSPTHSISNRSNHKSLLRYIWCFFFVMAFESTWSIIVYSIDNT